MVVAVAELGGIELVTVVKTVAGAAWSVAGAHAGRDKTSADVVTAAAEWRRMGALRYSGAEIVDARCPAPAEPLQPVTCHKGIPRLRHL